MIYRIIRGDKILTRDLGGCRNLAEILTEEEAQLLLTGKLIALSGFGSIMSLSSPAQDTVKLVVPTKEILSIFKNGEI